MGVFKGDYIGFTFGDHHSSEYNIARVSASDRYTTDLSPEFTDKTVEVPGGDGVYFFNSYDRQRVFSINIAFDNMSEKQMIDLQNLLHTKNPQKLIFDERPYIYYMAKIQSVPKLTYLTFDTEDGRRIHKGEGQITFISYTPYGYSRYKFLDEYTLESVPEWVNPNYNPAFDSDIKRDMYVNKTEWAVSSYMRESKATDENEVDKFIEADDGAESLVYNAGDLECDNKIFVSFEHLSLNNLKIALTTDKQLYFKSFSAKGSDQWICIDSKKHLVEGYIESNDQLIKTNNIYNEFIIAGDFFKITPKIKLVLSVSGYEMIDSYPINDSLKIDYSYLYI